MPVIELTVVPPSLIESAAMCEWQSMMPGDTNLPVPSTTSAPAGTATFAPTAAIFPPRSTIVPFWIVPLVAVRMVALRIATTASVRVCACGRVATDATAMHINRKTMDVNRRAVIGREDNGSVTGVQGVAGAVPYRGCLLSDDVAALARNRY